MIKAHSCVPRHNASKMLTDQARQAQDQGVISVIGSNCGSTRAMMNAFYCLDVQYC